MSDETTDWLKADKTRAEAERDARMERLAGIARRRLKSELGKREGAESGALFAELAELNEAATGWLPGQRESDAPALFVWLDVLRAVLSSEKEPPPSIVAIQALIFAMQAAPGEARPA